MAAAPELRVERLSKAAVLPVRMSAEAAGLDLAACLPDGDLVLGPGERSAVPTGLRVGVPRGHEGQVRPRSGLALRHGISLANAPGTIDADYRGELKVLLVNLGREPFVVHHGDRIAQLVVCPIAMVEVREVEALADPATSDRGEGGFGSTGV